MAIGDQLAQNLVEKRSWDKIDLKRTAEFTGIGFFFVVSIMIFWKLNFFSEIISNLKNKLVHIFQVRVKVVNKICLHLIVIKSSLNYI